MQVAIVQARRGDETVVGVRTVRGERALFACAAVGARNVALALVEAVAFCARNGHAIVTLPWDDARLVSLGDGSQWVLHDSWLRHRSSRDVVAALHAMRDAVRAASECAPAGYGPVEPVTAGG
jgi:hypothetical protein